MHHGSVACTAIVSSASGEAIRIEACQTPTLNLRPTLPSEWVELHHADALADSPAFAQLFFRALEADLPETSGCLRFLRHPQDRDQFGLLTLENLSIAIQIDVDLDYIVIWGLIPPSPPGEHGDWGKGQEHQVKAAISHLGKLIEAAQPRP